MIDIRSKYFLVWLILLFSFSYSWSQFEISTDPAIVGTSTGSINIVADGSAGPYDIEVYNADDLSTALFTEASSLGTFVYENLPAGTYRILITDRYDCETAYDITIEEAPCELSIYLVSISHPAECMPITGNGCNEGAIEVQTSIDPALLDITWAGATVGGSISESGLSIDGLIPGAYTVTASFSADQSCTTSMTYYIDVCSLDLPFPFDLEKIKSSTIELTGEERIYPGAEGACDGQILLDFDQDINGDNHYLWTNTSTGEIVSTEQNLTNGCAGEEYLLTITNGCYTQSMLYNFPDCDGPLDVMIDVSFDNPYGGPNCSPTTSATVTVAIVGDSEFRDITYYGRSGRGSDLTFINGDDVSTSENGNDRSFSFDISGLVPSDYVFSFRDECGFTYESAEVPTYTCEPIEAPYNRDQIFGDIAIGLRNGSCYNSDGALWWDSQTELEIDLSAFYGASPSCADYTIEWPGYDVNGSDEDNEGLMTTIGAEGANGETSFDIPGPGSYEIKVSNDLCEWSYTFVVQPSNGLSISGWAVIDQNSFSLRDFNQPVIMGKYLCSTCRNHNEIGTTESYLDICNDTHEKVTYEDLLDNVTPFYFDADDADNPCAGGTFYYVDEDGISQSIEVSGGVQSPITDGAGEAFLNFDCREYAACIFDNLSLGAETPPLPVMAISCVRPSEFVAVYDEILIDEDYLEDETCVGPFVYVPVGECIYNVYCGNNPTQLLEYENGEKAENIEMDQFDVCYTMIDESNCTKNFYCIGPEGYSQLVNVETIPCNTINLESFGQCPY